MSPSWIGTASPALTLAGFGASAHLRDRHATLSSHHIVEFGDFHVHMRTGRRARRIASVIHIRQLSGIPTGPGRAILHGAFAPCALPAGRSVLAGPGASS